MGIWVRNKLICISAVFEKKGHKQDKVNYAVSEKEGRVTDLIKLTRRRSYTRMYLAAVGCSGL